MREDKALILNSSKHSPNSVCS